MIQQHGMTVIHNSAHQIISINLIDEPAHMMFDQSYHLMFDQSDHLMFDHPSTTTDDFLS